MTTLEDQMIHAAHEGDFLAVSRYLKEGADVHVNDTNGLPLYVSMFETGHEDIARLLAAHGAGDMRRAYEHRREERLRALKTTGLDAHTVHMRIRAQQCVLCGQPMNYLRYLVDEKHYCVSHETEDPAMMHAIETLSAFW